MKLNITNILANASISGYYDPSIGLITVWFHKSNDYDNDIVAYLKKDMSWDLREVISEKSILFDTKEVVNIEHKLLGKFHMSSSFDIMIRKLLDQMIEYVEDKDEPNSLEIMKIILKEKDYNKVRN